MPTTKPPFGVVPGATRTSVAALAKTVIGKKKFILVSNREPYEHVRIGRNIVARKTIGGLTAALEPIMESTAGTWLAWGSGDADEETADESGHVPMPPGKKLYTLRRVWLTPDEVEKYYDGQANQTLWPLCHLQVDKVRFLHSEWDVYQKVNRRFCDAVAEEIGTHDGIVWFQDYHFATAPAMLRDRKPDAFILQFWHIPWPPWEIFCQHPQRTLLLRGLLGCDVIGMQLDQHCENFFDCIEKGLGLPTDRERGLVLLEGRTVRVCSFPISIDATAVDALASTGTVRTLMTKYENLYDGKGIRIGVGVERADYTKGILLRLRALDALFTQYPQWKEKFTFLQISPASRSKVRAYSVFRDLMEQLISDINRRHGTASWQPVVYLSDAKTQEELVALFRLADIAVVSSRQDGMNLVAKEFIASRCDDDGVLILSEFAGAAEEMRQSLVINPYDVEGFAHAMHTALTMRPAERRSRMKQLRNHLFHNTVFDWLEDILHRMPALEHRSGEPLMLLEHLDDLRDNIARCGKVELFCDYDGVLTPIAARPEEARLDRHMHDLLVRLRNSANVHVSVISGRALKDVSALVGIERLTYAGNHGLEVGSPRVQRIHPEANAMRGILKTIYAELRVVMRAVPGVIIEDKELGVSMHFRMVEPARIAEITHRFYAIVESHDRDRLLRITPGKCVLEARPNVSWNKGKAAIWLLEALHGDMQHRRLVIYLGDDITDEDAFRELRYRGITVFVGSGNRETVAQYRLPDTAAVATFLEWLTHAVV